MFEDMVTTVQSDVLTPSPTNMSSGDGIFLSIIIGHSELWIVMLCLKILLFLCCVLSFFVFVYFRWRRSRRIGQVRDDVTVPAALKQTHIIAVEPAEEDAFLADSGTGDAPHEPMLETATDVPGSDFDSEALYQSYNGSQQQHNRYTTGGKGMCAV